MARVTGDEVKAILDTELSSDQLAPFIEAANTHINNVLVPLGSSLLDDDALKLIERWLAAHFACTMDPRAKAEAGNGVSVSFQGQTGKGLESTMYGQNAMTFDPTGTLKAKDGKRRATMSVIALPLDDTYTG